MNPKPLVLAILFTGVILTTVFLVAGCGGGAASFVTTPPPTPAPSPINIQGQWQVAAQSAVSPTNVVVIEANFTQSGANIVADKSSVLLIEGTQGANGTTLTGFGGECDSGALGNDSVQATVSSQTQLSFTLTQAGPLGTGSSTGTATISSDGTQITNGTYTTLAACGFVADNGSVVGSFVKPFAGTYSGMLINGATTDSVTVTVSQTGYNLNVVGTDNGVPFTLSGKAVGATFDLTGTLSGRPVEYVGIFEPGTNDFRIYDNKFNFLGSLQAGTTVPIVAPISVSVTPVSANVQAGQSQKFAATVANDSANKGVTWALSGPGCSGAACGTLSPASSASDAPVTYTAPPSVPNPSVVTLTATAIADTSKFAAATVTVVASPATIIVTVSPVSANVQTGLAQPFIATVQNDTQNKGVTWTLTGVGCGGTTCGSLSTNSSFSGASITYTAPGIVPNPSTVTITATSVQDGTKSGVAAIAITAAPPPTSQVIDFGLGQSPNLVVDANGNVDVSWLEVSSPGSVVFAQSTDDGATFSSTPITTSGVVSLLEMGVDGQGQVNLLWQNLVGGTTIGGTTFGNSVNSGKTFTLTDISALVGNVGAPELTVSATGTIDLAQIGRLQALGQGVFSTVLTNGGQGRQPPVEIASNANDVDFELVAASGAQGQIYVAWQMESEFVAECAIMFSRSLDGGMTFSTPINISNNPAECGEFPQIFVDSSGAVNLAWTTISGFQDNNGPLINPNELYFARSIDLGATFSTPVALVGINQYTSKGDDFSGVGDPQLAVEPNGAIDVVFDANTPTDTIALFARSTDGGITFGQPITLATGGANSPTIALDSCGGTDVTWAGGTDVFFSRSADGMTFSTPTNLSNTQGGEFNPLISTDTKGSAYIVWEDTTNVFFQAVRVCK